MTRPIARSATMDSRFAAEFHQTPDILRALPFALAISAILWMMVIMAVNMGLHHG